VVRRSVQGNSQLSRPPSRSPASGLICLGYGLHVRAHMHVRTHTHLRTHKHRIFTLLSAESHWYAMKPQFAMLLAAACLTLLITLDVSHGKCMNGVYNCADCTDFKRNMTFCGGFDDGGCHLRCCNNIATRGWACVVQPHAGWCLGPTGYGPLSPSPCSISCYWPTKCYPLTPGSDEEMQCTLESKKLSEECRKCISDVWLELTTCYLNCST